MAWQPYQIRLLIYSFLCGFWLITQVIMIWRRSSIYTMFIAPILTRIQSHSLHNHLTFSNVFMALSRCIVYWHQAHAPFLYFLFLEKYLFEFIATVFILELLFQFFLKAREFRGEPGEPGPSREGMIIMH